MAFGAWSDGNQLGATDLNTKVVQVKFVDKPSDESVTSSVAIQNDNHLLFAAAANTNYWIKAYIMVDGHDGATGGTGTDGAGGIEYGWYGPTDASFDWCSDAVTDDTNGVGEVSRVRHSIASLPDMMTVGANSYLIIPAVGVLKVAATAGVFGFRWTQATSNATPTRVKALSGLLVTKLV